MASASQTIFVGSSEHSIDEKGRLCINSTFRACMTAEERERGFVLTKGYDNCLALYTMQRFAEVSDQIGEGTRFSEAGTRAYTRDLFGEACFVQPDSQGRVIIPPALRKHANITKLCVERGTRDHIEIWAKETLEAYLVKHKEAIEKGGGEMPF